MNLLTSIRDLCRSRHDAGLPLARPIAASIGEAQLSPGWLYRDAEKAAARVERWAQAEVDRECGRPADAHIVFDLATIRSCRPTVPDPDPEQIAAMVEAVTRCVVEATGGKVTGRMRRRVADGVSKGLAEIGVAR